MIVFFAGFVFVAFMAGCFLRVVAGASVFEVGACRAIGHIEVKLLSYGFGIGAHLDLEDYRKTLAFGDDFVRDEFVAVLGEGEFRWCRAVAHGDSDHLGGGGDDLARIVEETDFHFLVGGDEELGIWRDSVNDAATVMGFDFLRSSGEGEAGDDGGDGCYFSFHNVCLVSVGCCFIRGDYR